MATEAWSSMVLKLVTVAIEWGEGLESGRAYRASRQCALSWSLAQTVMSFSSQVPAVFQAEELLLLLLMLLDVARSAVTLSTELEGVDYSKLNGLMISVD